MQNRKVTYAALIALVVAGGVAYFLNTRSPAPMPATADAKAQPPVPDMKGAPDGKGPAPEAKAPPADGKSAGAPTKGGPGAGPVAVEVVELKPTTVQEDLSAVGTLRSNESVLLRPEVSGRIASINFRDGQAVKKGQVLVALDASLNEAEVAKARAEWNLAMSNLKRTEDLAKKNFVSGSAQETAASNVQVLEANLKLAEARLAKMRIVAPFDGVVGIRNVSVGDYVKDGADLINIEDVGTLKFDFRLPERNFAQIRAGQPIEVIADALPGERYRGVVEAINPRIEANGRSLEVRGRLANTAGKLRPGMFARVRVVINERSNALMVPEEAIVPAGEDFYVFRVADNQARRVKVKLGVRRDARVEIIDGLKAGDRVVTAGMRLFRDGQPVRVLNEAVGGRPSAVGSGAAAPAAASSPAKQ